MGGNSSGARVGWLVLLVGIVLGFPWLRRLHLGAIAIAAPFLNYALLWRLTIARVRRRLPVVTWSSALLAVAAAVALFAIAHFAIASLLPPNGLLRKSFLVFGAFMAPIVAIANLWVQGPSFHSEGRRLVAGLALPAVAALLEYVWLVLYGRMGYDAQVMMTVVRAGAFFRPDRANDGVPAKTRACRSPECCYR